MKARHKAQDARRIAMLIGCVAALLPASALAQPPKVEIAAAMVGEGASSAGTTRAALIDSDGQLVTLFNATHRTTRALGAEALIGIRMSPVWTVELSGAWSRPKLETRVSDDFEGADPAVVTNSLNRFAVELGVLRRFRRSGRADPYVRAAAGWVRELTADRTLVEDGVAAHAGAGLKYWMRDGQPGWLGHIALRAEIRLAMRRGGITLGETGTRWSPSVLAGLVFAR